MKYILILLVLILTSADLFGQYCQPNRPVHGGSVLKVDLIERVNLETLDNTSTRSNTVSYYDNTTGYTVPDLNINTNYTIVVQGQGGGKHTAAIWIDFNNNNIFDNSELVGRLTQPSSGTFTFNISIPNNPSFIGNHRMRVLWQYNASTDDYYDDKPCTIDGWGQTEDYTVNIINPTPCSGTPNPGNVASPIVLCNTNSGFILKTDTPLAIGTTCQWEVSNDGTSGWTNVSGATTNPYTYSSSVTLDKYFRLKVYCSNSGQTAYSDVIQVTGSTSAYPFGQDEWIAYAFQSEYTHTQYKNLNTTFANYKGFYTHKLDATNNYGINTKIAWDEWYSPEKTTPFYNGFDYYSTSWRGCSNVGIDNSLWVLKDENYQGSGQYTVIQKRKGFPPGNYSIYFDSWDDDSYIFINDQHVTFPLEYNGSNNSWNSTSGDWITKCIYLDQNSTIELRLHASGNPNSLVVSILPVNITLDIDAGPNTSLCHGLQLQLNGANNSSGAGAMTYTWTGNGIVSGANTLTPTVAPNGPTTYQLIGKYEMCADTATITVSMPVKTDRVSGNGESATCFIKGNTPIHFYDDVNGHYIGSINPHNRQGWVTMTSYLATFNSVPGNGDGTMYACNTNYEGYRTAYMSRNFTVTPGTAGISGSGNMDIYFPFTQEEYTDLKNRSGGNGLPLNLTPQNSLDDVLNLNDIVATRYDGPNENNTPLDNCSAGSEIVVNQSGSGLLSSAYTLSPAIIKNAAGIGTTLNYAYFTTTSFSEWTFHGKNGGSPLPIELTSFSASCDEDVTLTWITQTESNVSHYEIYSSRDGYTWDYLTSINAAGNSIQTQSYQYIDKKIGNLTYYRLESVDFNGSRDIYGPISTTCNNTSSWSVYPIPATDKTTINILALEDENAQLVIMDDNGRIVFSKEIEIISGNNQYEIDIQKLNASVYTVFLKGNHKFKPLKLIKL